MSRALDVIAAGLLLIVLAPVIVIVALVVRVRLGAPVLFKQVRAGYKGVPFVLVKFRTMVVPSALSSADSSDEARLTPLGRTLRQWSLDELPQLWNVLAGDMALVGPRPLHLEYGPLYSPRQSTRLDVRPGITGWAQVMGRNAISWDEKLELDAQYVERRSFLFDVKILAMTIAVVFSKKGIAQPGHATAEWFRGSK